MIFGYPSCVLFLSFPGFDIRIATTVDLVEFEEKIKTWCTEAGEDVTYEFIQVKYLCVSHMNSYR